jgi:hypothetical protein
MRLGKRLRFRLKLSSRSIVDRCSGFLVEADNSLACKGRKGRSPSGPCRLYCFLGITKVLGACSVRIQATSEDFSATSQAALTYERAVREERVSTAEDAKATRPAHLVTVSTLHLCV